MLSFVKDFIKTKPILYDFFNSYRVLDDELEQWIDQYSKSHNRPINFIQVGASDGLRWDPIRRFIVRDKWKGVLVEPLKPVFEILVENYSYLKNDDLKFENCAISGQDTQIDIWTYSPGFLKDLSIEEKLFYLRKSSLDKGQVEKHLEEIENRDNFLKCYETNSRPLEEIIEQYFSDKIIDLIFIDAEGFDDQVIRTINFNKCKPRSIVYENHSLGEKNKAIEEFLSEKGYETKIINGDTVASYNSNN